MPDTPDKSAPHLVSLFTREWIEIRKRSRPNQSQRQVSLFTREWIEIAGAFCRCFAASAVSLFTREWIEIGEYALHSIGQLTSPSLRGSGLK